MHFIQYVCTLRVAWHGRCVRCGCSCSHHQHVASFYMQKLMDYCGSTIHLLLLIICDLNIAHLIPPFQGLGEVPSRARGWWQISPLVITHGWCARGDVSSCSRTINGLSRILDTWPRGHTETRRHGYMVMLTTLLMTTATEHLVLGIMVLVSAGHQSQYRYRQQILEKIRSRQWIQSSSAQLTMRPQYCGTSEQIVTRTRSASDQKQKCVPDVD